MNINEMKEILSLWGRNKPLIKSIYIFGSRARNDFKSDSDLDIAITFDVENESDALVEWIDVKNEWEVELQKLISFKIHLEWNSGNFTPTIDQGIKESNILVYSKESQLKIWVN